MLVLVSLRQFFSAFASSCARVAGFGLLLLMACVRVFGAAVCVVTFPGRVAWRSVACRGVGGCGRSGFARTRAFRRASDEDSSASGRASCGADAGVIQVVVGVVVGRDQRLGGDEERVLAVFAGFDERRFLCGAAGGDQRDAPLRCGAAADARRARTRRRPPCRCWPAARADRGCRRTAGRCRTDSGAGGSRRRCPTASSRGCCRRDTRRASPAPVHEQPMPSPASGRVVHPHRRTVGVARDARQQPRAGVVEIDLLVAQPSPGMVGVECCHSRSAASAT